MGKPGGVKLALHSVSHVFQNLKLLATIALVWSAIVAVAVGAMCVLVAISEQSALAQVMVRMQEGDLLPAYLIASVIPSTMGQLAIAVRWSRLILLSESPSFTLNMPPGSARYFARSVILLFMLAAMAIPGFIVGAVVGRFVPGDPGRIAGVIAMIAGGLISTYVYVRMWLVFPAIAIGDGEVDFRRSFELSKGFTGPMLVGTVIAYVPLALLPIVIAGAGAEVAQLYLGGALYVAASLLSEFASAFLLLTAVAAAAGVLAKIYREVAPRTLANPQQIAVFE